MFTVVGSSGFIGSALTSYLRNEGYEVFSPSRSYDYSEQKDLGTVFYCAGYGDCKNDHLNVMDANVILLMDILRKSKFDKLFYISSTRVYMNSDSSTESSDISVGCNDNRRLFNLSKLVAEELCFLSEKNVTVIRPSNVYGLAFNSKLFLPQIIKNALINKHVDMYVDPEYSKDYLSVDDLVEVLLKLAVTVQDTMPAYNVASGVNVTAKDIADVLLANTECTVKWHSNVTNEHFPEIDTTLVNGSIDHVYRNVLADMSDMISEFKKIIANERI